eukprot:COSAG02_NODE_219_length_28538_cov_79.322058_22_plen_40_part_00
MPGVKLNVVSAPLIIALLAFADHGADALGVAMPVVDLPS